MKKTIALIMVLLLLTSCSIQDISNMNTVLSYVPIEYEISIDCYWQGDNWYIEVNSVYGMLFSFYAY